MMRTVTGRSIVLCCNLDEKRAKRRDCHVCTNLIEILRNDADSSIFLEAELIAD